jgi:hypothetical protein
MEDVKRLERHYVERWAGGKDWISFGCFDTHEEAKAFVRGPRANQTDAVFRIVTCVTTFEVEVIT